MSIDTATQRLRNANPAPDPNLLRNDSDDLTALLHATWQRSTTVQTQQTHMPIPTKKPKTRGWLIAVAVAAATIIVIGAVALLPLVQGSDEVADTPPTTLDAARTPTTEAPAVTTPTTYEIEAFDYGFRGLPAEFTAGDAIELVNSSLSEYHSLAVVRIQDDDLRSITDFAALEVEAFDFDNGARTEFQLVGALNAAPGEDAFDGRIRLQVPGTYLLMDTVREGADAAAVEESVDPSNPATVASPPYNVAGGLLGYQHGMIVIITVVAK